MLNVRFFRKLWRSFTSGLLIRWSIIFFIKRLCNALSNALKMSWNMALLHLLMAKRFLWAGVLIALLSDWFVNRTVQTMVSIYWVLKLRRFQQQHVCVLCNCVYSTIQNAEVFILRDFNIQNNTWLNYTTRIDVAVVMNTLCTK